MVSKLILVMVVWLPQAAIGFKKNLLIQLLHSLRVKLCLSSYAANISFL